MRRIGLLGRILRKKVIPLSEEIEKESSEALDNYFKEEEEKKKKEFDKDWEQYCKGDYQEDNREEEDFQDDEPPREVNLGDSPGGLKIYE